jgi:hypothetical protein
MTTPLSAEPADRFAAALARFDAANAGDPSRIVVEGKESGYEQAYADWLAEWVERLQPDASEALRLAARCQHIRRWEIPRDTFPATREGYLRWRETLKRHHAEVAGRILADVGYPAETIERVRSLNLKLNLKDDAECQTLEDALCLVFLERQFDALAAKASEEKLVVAVRKSWAKMSPAARDVALKLPLPEATRAIVAKALAEG